MLAQGWSPEDLVKQSNQKPLGTGANTPPFSKMAEQICVNCNQTMWLVSSQGSVIELLMEFTFMVITSQVCTHEPCPAVWLTLTCYGLNMNCAHRAPVLSTWCSGWRCCFESCWELQEEDLPGECCVMSFPLACLSTIRWTPPTPQAPMAMFCLTTGLGLMGPNTVDWNLQTVSKKVLSFVQWFVRYCPSKEKSN